MKLKFIVPLAAVVFVATPLFAEDKPAPASRKIVLPEKVVLTNDLDKISYAIGMTFGGGSKQAPVAFKLELMMAGLRDSFLGTNIALTEAEQKAVLDKFEKDNAERDSKESKLRAEQNKKDGIAFLAENKKKEGVKVTASGLQYKILKEGDGPSPKPNETAKIHYRGTLINGFEFDSSYKRKAPTLVPLNRIIRGWSEALQMMKVGSKWQLVIPSELAYGSQGAGREVPPNAVLIYEMELLSIENSSVKQP